MATSSPWASPASHAVHFASLWLIQTRGRECSPMVDQAYRRGPGPCRTGASKVGASGEDNGNWPVRGANIPERTDPSCPTARPTLCRVVEGVATGDDPAGARNHGTPAMPGATGTAASAQAMGPPRLLDRVRQTIRARHYSPRTEKAYVGWIRRYIFFHGKRHPDQMGAPEVMRFLAALATRSKVSASTQNQAFSALLFLYRDVLGRQLTGLKETVRAKPSVRVPLVLARDEVSAILRHLHGVERLMASVMYGAGLRLLECCHLRVKDLDFTQPALTARGV